MDLSFVRVPAATNVCVIVSLAIGLLLPVALLVIWAVKANTKMISALWGAGCFVVFALIIEALVHRLVLQVTGTEFFTSFPFYPIYGGLAAGIFEECGRYIVMRFIMKKKPGKKESIMFGIGHGGIESIILVGIPYISNIAMIAILNTGNGNVLMTGMDEATKTAFFNQISPLWLSPSVLFLAAGFERIFAITFHICASYIVYRAVSGSKPVLLILAIALHALMDGVMVVIQRFSGSTVVVEAFLGVYAIVMAIFTVRAYLNEAPASEMST
ncbi:MAG: YhfC family intramembrane metalloprotease [Lachnospiraceae bacterium]|nr:YhfC family intramembrane metalloprotease [Lachnospiraceae bacterium]